MERAGVRSAAALGKIGRWFIHGRGKKAYRATGQVALPSHLLRCFGGRTSVAYGLGRIAAVAALLMLANCGVYGAKGNDTGGIIPWSPMAEQQMFDIAQSNCGAYDKYALITSVHREYGDYIGYVCSWQPPHAIHRRPR
jgi:hypothetical protein